MKTALLVLLIIHILSGLTALIAGGISMFTQKGGKRHKKSGMVYFYAMISVGATAFVISIFKDIYFLLMISVFALYMTVTGYRSLLFMRKVLTKPAMFDWLFLAFSLAFIGIFSWHFFVQIPLSGKGMQPVLAVFNIIFLSMVIKDFFTYLYYHQQTGNSWLIQHIIRMMGAYISTITAFLVTNVHSHPVYLAWLAPTVFITPIIFYYVAKYRKPKKKLSLA